MVLSKPFPLNDRTLKRARTEVVAFPPLSAPLFLRPENFPRFLLIQSVDKDSPITSKSVFLVAKFIESVIGANYKAKKLTSGDILVEVQTREQSSKLLTQTDMHDVKISVTPHRSLNSSQGVISEPDLMKESDSDILDGMRDQGVTAVRRIMIRRDGNEIPTKHVILTFDRCTLPQSVTAGFLHCEVRPYIPNPRRCFKCQRYGHSTNSCRGRLTCAKCAEHDHPTENCKTDHLKCANCQQPHAAYSRTCDKFKAEKQIINLKVTQNITYQEARRKHAMFSPRYADAARRGAGPRMVSVATQCSSADLVPPLPPGQLPSAAQNIAALPVPMATVATNTAGGAVVSPVSLAPAPNVSEGLGDMDTGELAPPSVPAVPRSAAAEERVARQGTANPLGARSKEPDPSAAQGVSVEEMDTTPTPAAPELPRERRPSVERRKQIPRVTGPPRNK